MTSPFLTRPLRSEAEARADLMKPAPEPATYYALCFRFRKTGGLDLSTIYEDEDEARENAVSNDMYEYLYTLMITREGARREVHVLDGRE